LIFLRSERINTLRSYHYQPVVWDHAPIARLGMLEENLDLMTQMPSLRESNRLSKKELLKYGLHQKTQVLMGVILGLVFLNCSEA